MFSNDFATLTLYKHFRNRVNDYVIRFHSEQKDIQVIVQHTFDIVKALCDMYHNDGKMISGRMIAYVTYFHIEKEEEVRYFHASYRTEKIDNIESFFTRHMQKICERMDDFNRQGSNLLIKCIPEIHIHINVHE